MFETNEEVIQKLKQAICDYYMGYIKQKINSGKENEISTNLDIIFVIDNTISMVADDYEGEKTRIEGREELGKSLKLIPFLLFLL